MTNTIWQVTSTANADLCRQLHDVTGWKRNMPSGQVWNIGRRGKMIVTHYRKGIPQYARNGPVEDYCELSQTTDVVGRNGVEGVTTVPAYDLGYLLARVPQSLPAGPGEFGMFILEVTDDGRWAAGYTAGFSSPSAVQDTPEDAVAALCVALAHGGHLGGLPAAPASS